jgi:hypothetical protein
MESVEGEGELSAKQLQNQPVQCRESKMTILNELRYFAIKGNRKGG